MDPFISSDDLAAYLGEAVDGFELLTQIALDASCQLVRDDIQQTVNLVRDDEELYDGNNRETLILRQMPVIEVLSVMEDDDILEEVDDYIVDLRTGMIHRTRSDLSSLGWTSGRQNISVIYDHGWAITEADVVAENSAGDPLVARVPSSIRLVALELAARIYKAPSLVAVNVEGVTAKEIGSFRVEYGTQIAEAIAEGVTEGQHNRIARWQVGAMS